MAINLNENQQKAVTYTGLKPLVIEAGPGSGKTRVIIERIKFLLNKGVDASSMLVITFTKKAAGELKDRLSRENISQDIINEMQISTIHSFCIDLLNENNENIFRIYDEKQLSMFLSLHKKDLGFINEFYVSNGQLRDVVAKYSEYSLYDVNTNQLINYIRKNHPYREEYVDFVKKELKTKGKFPKKAIKLDKDLKKDEWSLDDDWYNARYLKIAESYPRFLKLLKKYNITTYNLVQKRALDFLAENPETRFTNILIDEFQDTDPLQIQIFEILLENALPNKGSFTVVGDADQKIYGFRGATGDYFTYLNEKYYCERISLDYNYRSTNDIIAISDNFISHQRNESSVKKLKSARGVDKDSFYMICGYDCKTKKEIKEVEAENIFNLINYLVDVKNIDYSDIAVLYRSLNNDSKELANILTLNDIPFNISGLANLETQEEIQLILALFYYIIDSEGSVPVKNSWTGSWLDLYTLADSELLNLDEATSTLLKNIHDNYDYKLLEHFKEEYEIVFGKKSRIRSAKGIFNKNEIPDEFIENLFTAIEKPTLNYEKLIELGLNPNSNDNFFLKFNKIISKVKLLPDRYKTDSEEYIQGVKEQYMENLNLDEIPTILDIFYELLEITGILNRCGEKGFKNIARLSQIIYQYENVVSKYDFKGLFWYLSSNLRDYESSQIKEDGVFLSTIHKSKGLEFPVVIIASIRNDGFPKTFKNPAENKYKNGVGTFYTPHEFLKYKNLTLDEEEVEFYLEEERLLYVALTRAQDIAILSVNIFKEEIPDMVKDLTCANSLLKPLNLEEIPEIESYYVDNENERLNLSYTGLNDYQMCPLKYNLIYNYGFKQSDSEDISYGLIMHEIFNIVNKKLKEEKEMPDEKELEELTLKIYYGNQNIIHSSEELNSIIDAVYDYYNNFGLKVEVLESEYEFNIRKDNYDLKGAIDLIYKLPNGQIGILDYKNSENGEEKKYKYIQQLSTYILALKNDNKYKNLNIGETKIYTMKDSKLIDIDITNIKKYYFKINKTADKIENEEFKAKKTAACRYCKFKFMCYH